MFECNRCKKEIRSIVLKFETKTGSEGGTVELCKDCFSGFLEWMNNTGSDKLGPVEQIAKRETPKQIKLGPVERVAKRKDSK